MDYTSYNIKQYDQLFTFSQAQIQKLIKQQKQLLFYYELVIDVTNFDHPGNNNLLQGFINKPAINIVDPFKKYKHSYNAELLICLRTIGIYHGQKNVQQEESKGRQLYQRIRQNQKIKLHQSALQKIDFTKPILKQLLNLTTAQKQIMVQIPKLLDNPQKVRFKQTPMEQYLFTNSFWVSSITFQLSFMCFMWYLLSNYQLTELSMNFPFFLIGILKWTLLQYYFHRFLLHYDMSTKNEILDHLLHHSFPNMKNKLAISVHKILLYFIVFYAFYSLFLSQVQIIILLSGLLISITFYDIVHYWCHFGYQTNIAWINHLRRNHLKHHYRDQNKGFGVTSTIWDKVFGTQHVNV